MDVVVADIPTKFGMLLSWSWDSKLKGTLQMDMSFANIPLFGSHRILYGEKILAYVVSSKDKPEYHSIYVVDVDLGSSIFFHDSHVDPEIPIVVDLKEEKMFSERQEALEKKHNEEGLWQKKIDGSLSKEGVGAGVWKFIIIGNLRCTLIS